MTWAYRHKRDHWSLPLWCLLFELADRWPGYGSRPWFWMVEAMSWATYWGES